MKLRFTSKDLILAIGVLVATYIVVAIMLYRDNLIVSKPVIHKKIISTNHAAFSIQKSVQSLLEMLD